MGANYSLNSIETRGINSTSQGESWVETYKLACSREGEEFLFATNSACLEANLTDAYVFDGNTDVATNVSNDLSSSNLVCDHIRVYPVNISGIGALYVELYGGK